ncbi:uncharacterized protein LOC117339012 [Pecten maximus]|uniref:uncharacterized protein LOC117339012 n=1 Tax=Pecten maximus TaxID=6579 RepID=UPI0014582263|nr:uncharacterized protein LOC117339012 [Pecten maximus]
MATSLDKGQVPSRAKGQTTCIHHKGRQLDLFCEECSEIACTQCLATVHKRHSMCELQEIIPQKKKDITDFIDKIENVDLVQTTQYISSVESDLNENSSRFEQLSIQLKNQTKKLKKDLDLLASETLSLYRQMEEDNARLLQTYRQDLERFNTQLKQQIQECKLVLQRGSNLEIYDTARGVHDSHVTFPVKPELGTVTFSPNRNPITQLKLAVGEMSTSGENVRSTLQGQDRPLGTPTDKGTRSKRRQPRLTRRKLPTEQKDLCTLWPKTKLIDEFQSPCKVGSLCSNDNGQLWTKYGKALTLLDADGTVIQRVDHSSWINAISLSPKTNALWICDDDNIFQFESGKLKRRFSVDDDPLCICITSSNEVIVGMTCRIAKFTTKGAAMVTTASSRGEEPLVRSPYKISECRVTQDIGVIERNSERDGGNGNQQVVVFDTDLHKQFVYNGDIASGNATQKRKPFDPCDLAYDVAGNLVVGDCANCHILLLSGCGDFLRVIHTDKLNTWAVGLDKDDDLWAVFGGTNIKHLKYKRTK